MKDALVAVAAHVPHLLDAGILIIMTLGAFLRNWQLKVR